MGFQDLKKVLKNKFKIEREIEQTGNDVFRGDLYKNEYYNDYCFIKLRMKFCEISFFKCDSRKFEKIEDEFLENSITFKIPEEDYLKAETIFNWLD